MATFFITMTALQNVRRNTDLKNVKFQSILIQVFSFSVIQREDDYYMVFYFKKEEYDFILKYIDWDDLDYPYTLDPEKYQIITDNKDKSNFLSAIDDIIVVYGLTPDQNMTNELGDYAQEIYNKVYWQIEKSKAPT
nr:MAG TPA: hypothetical protein [Caudoviricetes sp.]